MESKKFYWLKLKRDFFKRHDVFAIEGMPEGERIVLFYLKLMLESIDHEGQLRFSESKPYTPELLSSIFRMDIELVRTALKILEDFELIRIAEDGTIIVEKLMSMVVYETEWAKKKAEWREKKDKLRTTEGQDEDNVLEMSSEERTLSDKRKSQSKSQRKSQSKSYIFTPPTREEVAAYCQERDKGVDPERWFDYYTSNGWKVGKNPMKDWKAAVRTWERDAKPQTIPKKEETFVDLLARWESEDNG